jgi:hypothetical protein
VKRRRAALAGSLLVAAIGLSPVRAGTAAPPRYHPPLTAWGDPDFRATWTTERIAEAGIPLERPAEIGERARLTDAEFAKRLDAAKKSDAGYREDVDANGTAGLAAWVAATPYARRASLIVSPANGRLPPMTPAGETLFKAGRNSWVNGQPIDWVADLDSYDRCVARGIPSAILPWPNNNGIRVFQSPGFVVIQLEDLGARVIPLRTAGAWPAALRTWGGHSVGHWEAETLVIETDHIVAGDSADGDVRKHAGSPVTGRGGSLVPMSEAAHTVERLAMIGPNTIDYRVTYSDPGVFTAPWTAEIEWTRDDAYHLYEYACHEGNEVRELINASRAQRRKDGEAGAKTAP